MRQRFFGLIVLSVLVLGAASSEAHDRFRVIGTIVKIDAQRNLVTMKTTNKAYPPEVEIELTTKTRIERNGRTASRTDLRPGVYVVVDALGDDVFDLAAVLVRIVPKPASSRSAWGAAVWCRHCLPSPVGGAASVPGERSGWARRLRSERSSTADV